MARVVICEDDGLLAADLAQTVAEAGHEVAAVYGSARAALADPRVLAADMAIIDLNLADGDSGPLIAHTLQEAGLRVIILSGNTNATPDLGAIPHTYACKPVSQKVVRELIGGLAAPRRVGGDQPPAAPDQLTLEEIQRLPDSTATGDKRFSLPALNSHS